MTKPARSEHPRYGNMLRYDCGAGHDHPTRAHARRCARTRSIQATEPGPESDPHDSGDAS
jgi:hypothetical protein